MRTLVTVKQVADGYQVSILTALGVEMRICKGDYKAFDAAATVAEAMVKHAQDNPDGGEVMAPDEVLERVPTHLRNIAAKPQKQRY